MIWIMAVQGTLGAFDTVYFHEYRCRLPVHGPKVAGELRLHAARDFVYGTLYLTLPFVTWNGVLAIVLTGLIVTEVCITIWDFNVEVRERKDIGGVADPERALHLIMAVVYGVFLAHLAPHVWSWFREPTGFGSQVGVPIGLQMLAVGLGIGVLISGVRNLLASRGVPLFQYDLFAFLRPR